MARQKRSSFQGSFLLMGMLLIGAAFLCLIAGLMAAVLSPGALVRLLALPMGVMALIGMWVMPKRKTAPDALLNGLLLLLVLFINLWPAYIVYRFGGLPSVNPTKLAWLSLLMVGGFCILSCRDPMERLVRRCKAHPFMVFSVLFLFAWRVLSSAMGEQPISQVLSLAVEVITCYIAFFVFLAILRDEKDVYRLLGLLILVAIVQALLASYEAAVKHTLFDRFIVLSAEDSATMLDTVREKFRDGHYRAQGTFEHPMVLAEFMAMMAPLAVAVFLSNPTRLLRWASAAFIPLAFIVILSSRSRVGVVVLVAAVLLAGALLLLPRGRNLGQEKANLSLLMAILLLPVFLIVGYFALHEVTALVVGRSQGEMSSTMSRVMMLERGMPLIAANPFMGFGNGIGVVKLGFFDGVRYNIDNYWLGIALDSGIPGLLAFLSIFGSGVLLGLKMYKQRADGAGMAAGFMAIAILILLGCKTVLSIFSGLTLGYLLLAAIVVLAESPEQAAPEVEKKVKRLGRTLKAK